MKGKRWGIWAGAALAALLLMATMPLARAPVEERPRQAEQTRAPSGEASGQKVLVQPGCSVKQTMYFTAMPSPGGSRRRRKSFTLISGRRRRITGKRGSSCLFRRTRWK